MSSAYKSILEFWKEEEISFIKIVTCRGPSNDPYGKLEGMSIDKDEKPLKTTVWYRFWTQENTHLNKFPKVFKVLSNLSVHKQTMAKRISEGVYLLSIVNI